nr:unnamed protein product [uncultured bacterium]
MKILCISDQECPSLWDYYQPGRLKGYDLILACGDLNASYLSFVVTMASCPVLYVHGPSPEPSHSEGRREISQGAVFELLRG